MTDVLYIYIYRNRACTSRLCGARSGSPQLYSTILETCRAQCGASLSSRIVDACTRHKRSLKTCVMRQSFILVVANLGS